MLDYINKLSYVSYRLHRMANVNLEQLDGTCQEKEEVQDYYLGILRRQALITYDLHKILENRPSENLTTPYILLRALLDDFLHLLYLDQSESREEDIVRINAEGHRHHFGALKNLTDSTNQEYFGEQFHYLNAEELEALKGVFSAKPENQKYFANLEEFRLNRFISLTDVANAINGSENINVSRDRAFFLWKSFSSFVHYSNWSFQYELTEDIVKWQQMDESLQYVFNSINLAFKFFNERDGHSCKLDKFMFEEMGYALID